MLLRLEWASESPGRPVKTQLASPTPRVSDSVGLGWGLRICISSKVPGDADAAGPRGPLALGKERRERVSETQSDPQRPFILWEHSVNGAVLEKWMHLHCDRPGGDLSSSGGWRRGSEEAFWKRELLN